MVRRPQVATATGFETPLQTCAWQSLTPGAALNITTMYKSSLTYTKVGFKPARWQH